MPNMSCLEYANTLTTLTQKDSTEWAGPCPMCGGTDRFVVWDDDKPGWICRHCNPDNRGSIYDLAMKKEGLTFPQALEKFGDRSTPLPNSTVLGTWAIKNETTGEWERFPVNTVYDYHDPDGNLIYQALRYTRNGSTKNFGQRKPDANKKSGYAQTTKGCTLYPYRLPPIIAAMKNGETIYIVEGEKCADYLWTCGINATTNVGGAGMGDKVWKSQGYTEWFREAHVVIVADNDSHEKGENHARMIARKLQGIAASIDLRLSGTWSEAKGQGLDDWLDQGGSLNDLPELPMPQKATDGPTRGTNDEGFPLIDITNENLGKTTRLIWEEMLKSPYADGLYRYDDNIIYHNGTLYTLDDTVWRGMVNRAIDFIKSGKNGERMVIPPLSIIKDSMHPMFLPNELRRVERIVDIPVLDKDGQLLTKGYHETSRVLCTSDIELVDMSVDEAKELILDNVLVDFPFVDEASRANAVGLLLLPFVREMCEKTPQHLIDAADSRTGKGLLNDLFHIIWTGKAASVADLPLNPEEQRKALTTHLMEAPLSITFDDISVLTGHHLNRVITGENWGDRELRTNKNVHPPVRCVFIATGNNVRLGRDMEGRTSLIRLVSKEENPGQRTDFKRAEAEIRQWVKDDRALLVSACITMCRHGLEHGAAPKGIKVGGFDEWVQVLGTILNGCDIPDFQANRQALEDRRDGRHAGWKQVVQEWWNQHGEHPVKAGVLAQLIEDLEDCEIVLDGDTPRARSIVTGKLLKSRIGTVYQLEHDRVSIEMGKDKKGHVVYKLVKLDTPHNGNRSSSGGSSNSASQSHPQCPNVSNRIAPHAHAGNNPANNRNGANENGINTNGLNTSNGSPENFSLQNIGNIGTSGMASQSQTPETPDHLTRPQQPFVVWRNRDHDEPVVPTHVLGRSADGQELYIGTEGASGGLPLSELFWTDGRTWDVPGDWEIPGESRAPASASQTNPPTEPVPGTDAVASVGSTSPAPTTHSAALPDNTGVTSEAGQVFIAPSGAGLDTALNAALSSPTPVPANLTPEENERQTAKARRLVQDDAERQHRANGPPSVASASPAPNQAAPPAGDEPQASQPQASQPQASQPQASQPQASQPQASQHTPFDVNEWQRIKTGKGMQCYLVNVRTGVRTRLCAHLSDALKAAETGDVFREDED